jgi:hypothetical protein
MTYPEIVEGDYVFRLKAVNWVGASEDSDPLTVNIPYQVDPEKSIAFF